MAKRQTVKLPRMRKREAITKEEALTNGGTKDGIEMRKLDHPKGNKERG